MCPILGSKSHYHLVVQNYDPLLNGECSLSLLLSKNNFCRLHMCCNFKRWLVPVLSFMVERWIDSHSFQSVFQYFAGLHHCWLITLLRRHSFPCVNECISSNQQNVWKSQLRYMHYFQGPCHYHPGSLKLESVTSQNVGGHHHSSCLLSHEPCFPIVCRTDILWKHVTSCFVMLIAKLGRRRCHHCEFARARVRKPEHPLRGVQRKAVDKMALNVGYLKREYVLGVRKLTCLLAELPAAEK